MARPEPQFDVQRITNMRMHYPCNPLKQEIIRRESQEFKRIVSIIEKELKGWRK